MTDTPNNVIELPTAKAFRAAPPVKTFHSGETPPSVRAIARKENIDLASLVAILGYRRPADSDCEKMFVEIYLDGIEGMKQDDYGNRILIIGEKPNSTGV